MEKFFTPTKRLNSFGFFFFIFYALVSIAVSFFDFQDNRYIAIIYLLFVCYVWYFLFSRSFQRFNLSGIDLKWPLVFSVLILLAMSLMVSEAGNDFYHYVVEDMMIMKYHLNPYLVTPAQLPFEPATWLSYWHQLPAQHGPWRFFLTLPAAYITALNFSAGLFSYKVIFAIFFMASALVFYQLLKLSKAADAKRGLLLFLWNPLLLFGTFFGGGTDIMMVLGLLAAFYFCAQRRWLPAIIALAISVLVKYVTILILPFVIIYFFSVEGTALKKIISAIKQVLVFGLVVAGSFYPFWAGLAIFDGLLWVGHYFDLGSFPGFIASLSLLVVPNVQPYSFKLPFEVIFVLGYLSLLLKFYRLPVKDFNRLVKYSALALGLFLVLGKFWFYPKYLIWLLPLIFLSGEKYYNLAVFLSGLIVFSIVISVPLPFFFIVPCLVFGGYFYLKDLFGFEV